MHTEAPNLGSIYSDHDISHITGKKTYYKSEIEDRRPEIIFGFYFETLGKHFIDKS